MKRFIAIGGPTGSGKSSIAMEIAPLVDGEIVSCDSMQIYRKLDIGTAKPSLEDRKRVPHWMIDIKDPSERFSVADYVNEARDAIEDISSRGKTAIVCGGTGLYMSSLLAGTVYSESVPRDDGLREELMQRISREGTNDLISEIRYADPEYADKLNPNDKARIIRAVEMIRNGHTPTDIISASHGVAPDAVRILVNCSGRDILYRRIEERCDIMLENGILEEARLVYENRYIYQTAAAAIGYKEFFGYFSGTDTLEDCMAELKKASRRYAKRQLTWFRRESDFSTVYSDVHTAEAIAQTVKKMYMEEC